MTLNGVGDRSPVDLLGTLRNGVAEVNVVSLLTTVASDRGGGDVVSEVHVPVDVADENLTLSDRVVPEPRAGAIEARLVMACFERCRKDPHSGALVVRSSQGAVHRLAADGPRRRDVASRYDDHPWKPVPLGRGARLIVEAGFVEAAGNPCINLRNVRSSEGSVDDLGVDASDLK